MCLESSPDSAHAIIHSASLSSTSRKRGKKPSPTSKWKINPGACQNNKKSLTFYFSDFCFQFISWPVNTIFPSSLPTEAAKPKMWWMFVCARLLLEYTGPFSILKAKRGVRHCQVTASSCHSLKTMWMSLLKVGLGRSAMPGLPPFQVLEAFI